MRFFESSTIYHNLEAEVLILEKMVFYNLALPYDLTGRLVLSFPPQILPAAIAKPKYMFLLLLKTPVCGWMGIRKAVSCFFHKKKRERKKLGPDAHSKPEA